MELRDNTHTISDITLLCADDEEGILFLLKDILGDMVARMHTATTCEEALSIAKNEPVDIAIIDFRMPQMGGLRLLEELKKERPAMLVSMLSAYGDKTLIQSAIRLGLYDFIDKPFDEALLRHSVQRYIDRVKSDRYLDLILQELLLSSNMGDADRFFQLGTDERQKVLRALLGTIRLKRLRSQNGGGENE